MLNLTTHSTHFIYAMADPAVNRATPFPHPSSFPDIHSDSLDLSSLDYWTTIPVDSIPIQLHTFIFF